MSILHGRVAMVTGAGSGIGRATAVALARAGADVALVGRRQAPLATVAAEVKELGTTPLVLAEDLTRSHAARRIVDSVGAELGGLDILVNNAAHYAPGSFLQAPEAEFQRHFELNVHAPARLLRQAHPRLAESDAAVVINVLSNLAQRPVAGVAAYCASKAALLSLTRSWALEWAADGIRVVAVAPGVVDTPLHESDHLRAMAPLHPLGRVGRPEEVAACIVFLAGPDSAWTTGAVVEVDGGIHLV